jgi:glycosyltransferase involved in cell wall biosynthesis
MHILLVTHYYADHRGGVEIVAGELAARLAANGIEITWAASQPAPAALPLGVTALPMRAWNITERRLGFPYPLWSPDSLAQLVRAVRRCDAVHLHDCLYLGNVCAFGCARLLGKPVIVTQHVGLVPYRSRLLRTVLAAANGTLGRLVLGGSDQVVFISRKVQDYFAQRVRFRRPPLFVPNGVDRTRFSPVDAKMRQLLRARWGWRNTEPVLLFVGRFVEKKGLPILRRLAGQFPGCRWAFAGWGPEDPARWGLPNVQCLGSLRQEDLPDTYRAADLLVLPSVGEGFPLVVQEAMACGTPTLISDDTARGIPGIEALAFVSDLQWPALPALIERLTASPELLATRREQVADYARRAWDWQASAAIYRRLLAERRQPPRALAASRANAGG